MSHTRAYATGGSGSAWEVLAAFLKLGMPSFSGPIAHPGYFQRSNRPWPARTIAGWCMTASLLTVLF
jgi:hypothetical protein